MQRLDGKVAIVTGASRGLGKDIAISLSRQGATVVLAARTDNDGDSKIPGSLHHTAALIREAGGKAETVRCDVGSEEDITAATNFTIEKLGRIDILVNNAGILVPGTTMELQPKHWKLIFKINVDGPFNFCRAVIPHLKAVGGGHIINVSSRGAISPGPGPYDPATPPISHTAYGTTKAALERFSQGLAAELFRDNISVNVLSPHLPLWSEGGAYFRQANDGENYSGWRMSGEIIGDAAVVICNQPTGRYTGNILYDELVMRAEGGMGDAVMTRYPVQP